MIFDKRVEEKELIIWQLRIFCPTVSWDDLDKLYYVWKYPEYRKKWVEFKVTPNLTSSYALEQRLEEKGLIEFKGKHPDAKGKNKKQKGLPEQLLNILSIESVELIIKLTKI